MMNTRVVTVVVDGEEYDVEVSAEAEVNPPPKSE
jgi:hypothetical protein